MMDLKLAIRLAAVGWIALWAATANLASAATVFYNPANGTGGDCSFSTTCASQNGRGDDFAAQMFTVSDLNMGAPVIVRSGSFTTYVNPGSTQPNAVSFNFYSDNGGAPGDLLYNGGTVPLTQIRTVSSIPGFDQVDNFFSTDRVALNPSQIYYLAIQGVSSELDTYLAFSDGTGAFESRDGGSTFAEGYGEGNAIAITLYDTPIAVSAVPEPTTWALMIGGFGMVGGTIRARTRKLLPQDA